MNGQEIISTQRRRRQFFVADGIFTLRLLTIRPVERWQRHPVWKFHCGASWGAVGIRLARKSSVVRLPLVLWQRVSNWSPTIVARVDSMDALQNWQKRLVQRVSSFRHGNKIALVAGDNETWQAINQTQIPRNASSRYDAVRVWSKVDVGSALRHWWLLATGKDESATDTAKPLRCRPRLRKR